MSQPYNRSHGLSDSKLLWQGPGSLWWDLINEGVVWRVCFDLFEQDRTEWQSVRIVSNRRLRSQLRQRILHQRTRERFPLYGHPGRLLIWEVTAQKRFLGPWPTLALSGPFPVCLNSFRKGLKFTILLWYTACRIVRQLCLRSRAGGSR